MINILIFWGPFPRYRKQFFVQNFLHIRHANWWWRVAYFLYPYQWQNLKYKYKLKNPRKNCKYCLLFSKIFWVSIMQYIVSEGHWIVPNFQRWKWYIPPISTRIQKIKLPQWCHLQEINWGKGIYRSNTLNSTLSEKTAKNLKQSMVARRDMYA